MVHFARRRLSTIFGFQAALAACLTASALAQDRLQAGSTMAAILRQQVVDYNLREATAPANVRARLEALRLNLAEDKISTGFTVGYTTAADVPLEQLAGTRIPELPMSVIEGVNRIGALLAQEDRKSAESAAVPLLAAPPACSAAAATFDWRTLGKVTPVKAQICGTCWDFAALGAFEASWAIRNRQQIDASEQYILNCAGAGDCNGGWYMPVFDFLIAKGVATAASDPFTGNDSLSCPTALPRPYSASAWAFVPGASTSSIPSVAAIKQSLCEHGPLATAVVVDPAFQYYTGGVFVRPPSPSRVNHAIVIIGWDDNKQAWLIKNSWGPGWGETGGLGTSKGYMWIGYATNKVGVATAWVDAKSISYQLGPNWSNISKDIKLAPKAEEVK
jgi:C1A family cysteine protease